MSKPSVLRWLLGIGGFLLLQVLVPDVLDLVFALVATIAVLTTKDHRGLAYCVLKWRIQDDRTAKLETA